MLIEDVSPAETGKGRQAGGSPAGTITPVITINIDPSDDQWRAYSAFTSDRVRWKRIYTPGALHRPSQKSFPRWQGTGISCDSHDFHFTFPPRADHVLAMLRCFFVISLLCMLSGCAKQVDLPQMTVNAADAGEFTRFRSELGAGFPAERLQAFDTAVLELKLDAMNRDLATAAAREAETLQVMNGKSVQAVTILGWEARRARFLREIASIQSVLDRDLKTQQAAGPGGPSSVVLARIQSAQNVTSGIQQNLADAERRLTELHAVPEN